MAIALVTIALAMYASINSDRGFEDGFASLLLALVGSLGHSYMFVLAERAINSAHISPFQLSTAMGAVEASILTIWSWFTFFGLDKALIRRPAYALVGYAGLAVVDSLHALSFFATLGRRGAVSASLLKGVQIVLVYAVSQLLLRCYDLGILRLGCLGQGLCSLKSAAVALVVAGLALFYHGDGLAQPDVASMLARGRSSPPLQSSALALPLKGDHRTAAAQV